MKPITLLSALVLSAIALPLRAQDHTTMDHGAHAADKATPMPTLPGQDAYGAISEIVKLLQADPTTDWSKVNIERLRQHLIDMNDVTLKSRVVQEPIPDGVRMTVTGDGRTVDAIRRMTTSHGAQLAPLGLTAVSKPVSGGAEFSVTATAPGDTALIAKLRGLGFLGIMTLGSHHAAHHLAMARGEEMPGHDAH